MTLPLALYMDVHVPMAVTEALRRQGLDILTSQDDETAAQDDEVLLARQGKSAQPTNFRLVATRKLG